MCGRVIQKTPLGEIVAAFSNVPPFLRYAVIPVELWLPILVAIPAAAARRRIIAQAFACGSGVRVSLPVPRPIVRNSGPWHRRACRAVEIGDEVFF